MSKENKLITNVDYYFLQELQGKSIVDAAASLKDTLRQLRNMGKISDNVYIKLVNNVFVIERQFDFAVTVRFFDFKK